VTNSKVEAVAYRVFCGGQVATTLATCAALGHRTGYVGAFGNDLNGQRCREALARRGVDTSLAVERDGPNRHAVIIVDDRTGARTVIWHRDAGVALTAADLPRSAIASARLLHVDDLDVQASLAAAAIAVEAQVPVSADIDRVTDDTMRLVAAARAPIFSSHVPQELTGEADPERALRKLGSGRHGLLCVTLGEDGAMLLDGDRIYYAPAVKVNAVDTTGAGDVFRGAFIHALLRGDGPEAILRCAVAAAALSCTKEGALDSVPTKEEMGSGVI